MTPNDLISRSAVLAALSSRLSIVNMIGVAEIVESVPAVEAEPVVHAHWIWLEDELHECSACGGWECFVDCDTRDYCPQCGAHMDEEVAE